ncbi:MULTISPECIES: gephyrin-like molybdotransferase receptor GlpR [unclassified Streptomyces]|uniref:divisome protein SepX/GlpR n=1 Tax=unclassified Streptomyces TaxID=2593676 RepID=UPI00278C60A9|nr:MULTISPECIES: gephyrin-like molybdotransferase receptor GlpR [unclassified Streptomyces]
MSSSGLIYAVIVGAWAAYLVPMWLRRQDELNEARPTERFSTAIRLLSGRAGMERRYAKDLQARSPESDERRGDPADPDAPTEGVDVRDLGMSPSGERHLPQTGRERRERPDSAQEFTRPDRERTEPARESEPAAEPPAPAKSRSARAASAAAAAEAQAARARRTKVLARRRRTTVLLFVAFTVGAVVAAVGGVAFLWAPAAPAVLLSAYIVYLRTQERRRFAYVMDRRRAEVAAQRLRERQPRRRQPAAARTAAEDPEEGPAQDETATDPGLEALAADRRALVEQTDHQEWVDQQRERQRHPGPGDSWDPVPVPLPTYVTAPVAPRATGGIDYNAPETWSSARSSAAEQAAQREPVAEPDPEPVEPVADDGRSDARRAASARRSRERGRTPLFDQFDEDTDGRPRAANE